MKKKRFMQMFAGVFIFMMLCVGTVGAHAGIPTVDYGHYWFMVDELGLETNTILFYTGTTDGDDTIDMDEELANDDIVGTPIPFELYPRAFNLVFFGKLIVSKTITKIGAFQFDTSGIKEVYLPDGCVDIDPYAFCNENVEGFPMLKTVKLYANPKSPCAAKLTELGYTFYDPESGLAYETLMVDGEYHLTVTGYRNIVENVEIPEGVSAIAEDAFQLCNTIRSIEIPDSVSSIGDGAFFLCENLESVRLPEGLTKINMSVFGHCTALTNVNLPDSIVSVGGSAFNSCTSLTRMDLPDALSEIGSNAFNGSGLTEITIPGSVELIGYGAFENCSDLETVRLCEGVKAIETEAFRNCDSLKDVTLPNTLTVLNGFRGCTSLTSVVIPESATSVYGFSDCTSLESIRIPRNVKELGGFDGCTSLKNVVFAGGNIVFEDYTFEGCTALESIRLPKGLTEIPAGCFEACSELVNVVIPNTVARIDLFAFSDCNALKELTIPTSVNWISPDLAIPKTVTINCVEGSYADEWAQYGYYSVNYIEEAVETTLTLPAALTTITAESFSGVPVNVIIIPDGCTAIDSLAFANCPNLTTLYIPSSVISISSDALSGCGEIAIYAPAGSYAETFANQNGIAFVAY